MLSEERDPKSYTSAFKDLCCVEIRNNMPGAWTKIGHEFSTDGTAALLFTMQVITRNEHNDISDVLVYQVTPNCFLYS